MKETILVPVDLDILLVNEELSTLNHHFRNLSFDYSKLSSFESPETAPFDGNSVLRKGAHLHWTLPRTFRKSTGDSNNFPIVPNRWLIVRTFTEEKKVKQKSWIVESDCPNSDYLNSSNYLITPEIHKAWNSSSDPNRKRNGSRRIKYWKNERERVTTSALSTRIGKAIDLSQDAWSEKFPSPMFLKAVAPGNMDFSGFVPFNKGVFSFYDDLSNVPSKSKISYWLCGWFSDESEDIVRKIPKGISLEDWLSKLNWTFEKGSKAEKLDRQNYDVHSLYTGAAYSINWQLKGNIPKGDPLFKADKNISVSIANSPTDAFADLIGKQLYYLQDEISEKLDIHSLVDLLIAFQYDLLPLLNETNGEAILNEQIRKNWFRSKKGGIRWRIVKSDNSKSDSKEPNQGKELFPNWLNKLNQDQKKFDNALEELHRLQWELNAAWWKKGLLLNNQAVKGSITSGINVTELERFLSDIDNKGESKSLLIKLMNQFKKVQDLSKLLPKPVKNIENKEQSYLGGIENFVADKELDEGYELRSSANSRYWISNNPSVLISGVRGPSMTNVDSDLVIRVMQDVNTKLVSNGLELIASKLSVNDRPRLKGIEQIPFLNQVRKLYGEFILLDPSNKKKLNFPLTVSDWNSKPKIYNGVLPGYKFHSKSNKSNRPLSWRQPWNPIYLEWELKYISVPFQYKNTATGEIVDNWMFNGNDYKLVEHPMGIGESYEDSTFISNPTVKGRSLLGKGSQAIFFERIKELRNIHSKNPLKGFSKMEDQIKNWSFLAQELDGLQNSLIQKNTSAFIHPTNETITYKNKSQSLMNLLGFSDRGLNATLPEGHAGTIDSVPFVNINANLQGFHPTRGGWYYFHRLSLIDKFGRELDLITEDKEFINNSNSFPLMMDKHLFPKPNPNLKAKLGDVNSPFELPPRLLQPARLNSVLLDASTNETIENVGEPFNPVAGWVLVNHLDRSMMLFNPKGEAIGEISVIQKRVSYQRSPNSKLKLSSYSDLSLYSSSILKKSIEDFYTFLNVIDSTLWTTNFISRRTDQNLSVLMGRPLALVKMQLSFELEGTLMTPSAWPTPVKEAKTNPNVPNFTNMDFSIRLGDIKTKEDGVIGYFNNGYDVFNCVVNPNEEGIKHSDSIKPIGKNDNFIKLQFNDSSKAIVSVLLDPRGSIHATTGILPVKETVLENKFSRKALSSLEITFKAGPIITKRLQPPPTKNDKNPKESLLYMPIQEKKGNWNWIEGGSEKVMSLSNALTNQILEYYDGDLFQVTAEDGFLKFDSKKDAVIDSLKSAKKKGK